jgi:hypothetical protein
MIQSLQKALENDVWRLVDGKEVTKKDFFGFVISLLLQKEDINLKEALHVAQELNDAYDTTLKRIQKYIVDDYGDIIEVLKDVKKDFKEELEPIIQKVENL